MLFQERKLISHEEFLRSPCFVYIFHLSRQVIVSMAVINAAFLPVLCISMTLRGVRDFVIVSIPFDGRLKFSENKRSRNSEVRMRDTEM